VASINDDPTAVFDPELMFRQPPTATRTDEDPPATPGSPTSQPATPGSPAGGLFSSPTLRLGRPDATRTDTSRTSARGDARAAGKTVLALVGALVLIAEAIVLRTASRRLRRPSKAHMDDFAGPAGELAHRHGLAAILGEDVGNVVDMTGAVAAYLLEGPLTYRGPRVEYADDALEDPPATSRPDPLLEHAAGAVAPPYTFGPAGPPPMDPPPAAAGGTPHVRYLD
jgi:hypothetical protein